MNMDKLMSIDFFKNQDLEFAFDGLTKVLNREYISNYLSYMINSNKPFTVCLCDVDNFKNVNDNYGHMMGDVILQTFASNIEKSIDLKGVVGRYGGDEFMIILDGINEYNDVWDVCHKMNVSIGSIKFDNEEELNVTVTTGVARYPIDGMKYEELISKADRALYRGKMKGRNCFIIYLAAKHSNIMIRNDHEKLFSSMEMFNKIFNILTTSDLCKGMRTLCQYLSTYLKIDHICVETDDAIKVEYKNALAIDKEFNHINLDYFYKRMNSSGLYFCNSRKTILLTNSIELFEALKEQMIQSILTVKIECNNKVYGILRADLTSIKNWETNEMDLFVVAARVIGLILYKTNMTINDVVDK